MLQLHAIMDYHVLCVAVCVYITQGDDSTTHNCRMNCVLFHGCLQEHSWALDIVHVRLF